MSLFPLGLISQGGGAGGGAAFELISTTVLSSTASSVTFSSIPSTYKHLQIRTVGATTAAGPGYYLTINGDTGANYSSHVLYANGSSVGSSGFSSFTTAYMFGFVQGSDATGPTAMIYDFLDYANTNKNKTIRALGGVAATKKELVLSSSAWLNTSAINSIKIALDSSTFVVGSRFSLYGVRGE